MSTEITDVKEAALHAILRRLGEIDSTASTRSQFVGSHMMCQMQGLDKPMFEAEIELIQRALGIEPKSDKAAKEQGVYIAPQPREFSDEL